jgi:O-antigen/teichoic acid export membrane protein
MRRGILGNAGWLMVARASGDLLSFIVFLAIARRFGPDGSGAYIYAFAVANLVATLANPGLSDLAMRDLAQLPPGRRGSYLRTLLTFQALLAGLALGGLAVFLALSPAPLASLVIVSSLTVYLTGFTVGRTVLAPAFAREAMRWPAVLELACRGIAMLGALAGLFLLDLGLAWLLLGFPLAGLVYLGCALVVLPRADLATAAAPGQLRALAHAAWPVAAAELILQLYLRVDLILLSLLLGDAAAGIYATGVKLVEVGTTPVLFLALAALPRLSAGFTTAERGALELAQTLLNAVLVLGGLLAIGLLYVVPLLLVPLLGDRFAPSAALMPWMAMIVLAFSYEIVVVRVLLACQRQIAYFRAIALATIVKAAAIYLLVPPFGAAGAAAAALLALLLLDAACAMAVAPYWPLSPQLASLGRLLAAVVVTVLLAEAAQALGLNALVIALLAPPLYFALTLGFGLVSADRLRLLLASRTTLLAQEAGNQAP